MGLSESTTVPEMSPPLVGMTWKPIESIHDDRTGALAETAGTSVPPAVFWGASR